jgi:unsaturated chondroitin disaccharide hydrolase
MMATDASRSGVSLQRALHEAWDGFLLAAERDWGRLSSWPIDEFPHVTEDRRWERVPVSRRSRWVSPQFYDHGNWTAGFSLGTGALLHLAHGGSSGGNVETFRRRLAELAGRADDLATHDLGFLFFPAYAVGAVAGLVAGDELGPALRAARTLARRFNGWGGYIQAFGPIGDERSAGTSTIDTMMNLPLLWWAAEVSQEPQLLAVARRHAITSARVFLRGDGSTFHLARFDPLSGSLLSRGTYQGSAADSCWSRGQAWALCGFAWGYTVTRDVELLTTAERCARYFWSNLPADGVPPWDFSDRAPDATRDASAAAIAALGALILAEAHPDPAIRGRFREQGASLLLGLHNRCVNRDETSDGVVLHSCYSKPHGLAVDGAVAWGDFYHGLALALALGVLDLASIGCGRRAGAAPGGS